LAGGVEERKYVMQEEKLDSTVNLDGGILCAGRKA
jgi:hypothetical protein